MNFALPTFTTVKVDHVNVRPEKHGDKSVTAVDVRFVLTGENRKVLALLNPGLCDHLYYDADRESGQEEVEDLEPSVPNLRFPKLKSPFKWEDEITGARVEIDFGLGGESNIVFTPAKVNDFKADCMEGGTTELTFRVQCSVLPDGVLDKLGKLLNCETKITVVPPEAGKGNVIDGSLAAFEKDYPDAPKQPDATDLFVAQGGAPADGEPADGAAGQEGQPESAEP